MSYIGGLTKAQMTAFFEDEMKPVIQEVKALRDEISELRKQLGHKAKELYTIDDLANLFNVTKATIHNWVKEGKLVKYKTGGRSLFKKEDVQQLINYSKTNNDGKL